MYLVVFSKVAVVVIFDASDQSRLSVMVNIQYTVNNWYRRTRCSDSPYFIRLQRVLDVVNTHPAEVLTEHSVVL